MRSPRTSNRQAPTVRLQRIANESVQNYNGLAAILRDLKAIIYSWGDMPEEDLLAELRRITEDNFLQEIEATRGELEYLKIVGARLEYARNYQRRRRGSAPKEHNATAYGEQGLRERPVAREAKASPFLDADGHPLIGDDGSAEDIMPISDDSDAAQEAPASSITLDDGSTFTMPDSAELQRRLDDEE